jgi:hypothetical protein
VSFVVRVAEPAEFADAGRVTAEAYHADDLLRRTDGLIDVDYEAQLTDASRRAREAELLVAVDDGQVLGTVTWCPPTSPWRELRRCPIKLSSGCSRLRQLGGAAALAGRSSRRAWIGPGRQE